MKHDEDPNVYFARIEQVVEELQSMGETVSEMRWLAINLTGLSDDSSRIRDAANEDLDYTMEKMADTMRNMHANDLPSEAPRMSSGRAGTSRASVMAATTVKHKKDNCHTCSKLEHWARDCPDKDTAQAKRGQRRCKRHICKMTRSAELK